MPLFNFNFRSMYMPRVARHNNRALLHYYAMMSPLHFCATPIELIFVIFRDALAATGMHFVTISTLPQLSSSAMSPHARHHNAEGVDTTTSANYSRGSCPFMHDA